MSAPETSYDCRLCVHGHDVQEGVSVACAVRERYADPSPVPWPSVTGQWCSEYTAKNAKPSPAAPASVTEDDSFPASAPGLLEAAREVAAFLEGVARYGPGQRGGLAARASEKGAMLRRAIETEEARRADRSMPCGCVRCACEDPEQCHGCGAGESPECQRSRLSGGPRHAIEAEEERMAQQAAEVREVAMTAIRTYAASAVVVDDFYFRAVELCERALALPGVVAALKEAP